MTDETPPSAHQIEALQEKVVQNTHLLEERHSKLTALVQSTIGVKRLIKRNFKRKEALGSISGQKVIKVPGCVLVGYDSERSDIEVHQLDQPGQFWVGSIDPDKKNQLR